MLVDVGKSPRPAAVLSLPGNKMQTISLTRRNMTVSLHRPRGKNVGSEQINSAVSHSKSQMHLILTAVRDDPMFLSCWWTQATAKVSEMHALQSGGACSYTFPVRLCRHTSPKNTCVIYLLTRRPSRGYWLFYREISLLGQSHWRHSARYYRNNIF
jgi:hypothetical protein